MVVVRSQWLHSKLFLGVVCDRSEFWAADLEQAEHRITQLSFAAGPCWLTLGQEYRQGGNECSCHRGLLHTKIQRKACLRAGNASHPSGTLGMLIQYHRGSTRTPGVSVNIRAALFTINISQESRPTSCFFHGEPPTQARGIARG